MELMEENENGDMEFPQDIMLEDCFTDMEEVSFGFLTNVTLGNETCIENVECSINGTRLDRADNSTTMRNNNATLMNGAVGETDPQSLIDPITQKDLMTDLIDDIMTDHAKSKYMYLIDVGKGVNPFRIISNCIRFAL